MRIVMLPSAKLSYESGSTLYAASLASGLADAGHAVHVLCSELPPITHHAVQYHCLPLLEHPVIDDYPVSTRQILDTTGILNETLATLMSDHAVDAVHAHYATFNGVSGIATAQTLYGVPCVVSAFGRDVFNGARNDSRYARMVRLVVSNAAFVVCSNAAVHGEVLRYRRAATCDILPMPVDDRLFARASVSRSSAKGVAIVAICSCLAREKGLRTILRAFARVRELDSTARLTIVGADEHPQQANLRELHALCAQYDIVAATTFTGGVPHHRIPQLLAAADLLIDAREVGNYSSVILEACAMGRAIVASDVPGNVEFIQSGVNGLIFRSGDEIELASILVALLQDVDLRCRLQTGAEDWFSTNGARYSLYSHVEAMVHIFERCRSTDSWPGATKSGTVHRPVNRCSATLSATDPSDIC